jgi:hypothetical protein
MVYNMLMSMGGVCQEKDDTKRWIDLVFSDVLNSGSPLIASKIP